MTSAGLAIGIDLGGTRVKAGVTTADGTLLATPVEPVGGDGKSAAGIVPLLADVVARVAVAAGAPASAPVGMAAAGVLDARRGLIRESPNFPDWADLALGSSLAAACGRRVTLDNDANAVVLGEALAGAGRGARHVVGLTLGTGVGGGSSSMACPGAGLAGWPPSSATSPWSAAAVSAAAGVGAASSSMRAPWACGAP